MAYSTCVFQHVPKTAGTSLASLFRQKFGEQAAIGCERDENLLLLTDEEVSAASCIYGHLATRTIRRRLTGATITTCLRDPVDRVLSQYFDWRNKHATAVETDRYSRPRLVCDTKADPYDDLLRCLYSEELPTYGEIRDLMCWQLADHYRDRRLSPAQALQAAKRWLDGMAAIGTADMMDSYLAELSRILGPLPPLAVRLNANPDRPDRQAVPPSILAAIRAVNQLDLELFDHALERLHAAPAPRTIHAPAGPTRVHNGPKPRELTILEDHRYRAITGWMLPASFATLTGLIENQVETEGPECLIEFRPLFGQHLVGLGWLMPANTQVVGVDMVDDDPIHPSSAGSEAAIRRHLAIFFPPDRTLLLPSAQERAEVLAGRRSLPPVRAGLISRPYDADQVVQELDWLEPRLTPDGFVVLFDVHNHGWPQVGEGLYRFLSAPRPAADPLVPFLISGQMVLLCRRSGSFTHREFIKGYCRAKAIYPELAQASIAGHPCLRA